MHISGSATRLAVETVSCCATNGLSLPMSLSAWCLANWRLPMAITWPVSRKRVKKTPVGQHPTLVDELGHVRQLGEFGDTLEELVLVSTAIFSHVSFQAPPRVLSRPYHTSHQHAPDWQTIPVKGQRCTAALDEVWTRDTAKSEM